MTSTAVTYEEVREFWNERAGLGQWAGSRDVIAKEIEIEAIASYVMDGMKVLEIGCGNGITAIEIARRFDVQITAFDYAAEMIEAAEKLLAGADLRGSISFQVGDVLAMPQYLGSFDLIYTERVLINLPDWESQHKAIAEITALLADGGSYVMCENSQDGLEKVNALRARLQLPAINAPWHNKYFRDADLATVNLPGVALAEVNTYSSTYYLLSRVVNAWFAAQEGREPEYDSELNRLALKLPSIGDCGQGRIWLWRKSAR